VDDAIARSIGELLPLTVEVSIHGAHAATHDVTTGVPGSYRAAWEGVGRLQRARVRVVLKTPVTTINCGEIEALVEQAKERGLPLRLDVNLVPRNDGSPAPLAYRARPEAVQRVMGLDDGRALPHLRRAPGEPSCGLGRLTLTVDPYGEVFPCIQWRSESLGNVRRTRLERIWTRSGARRRIAAVACAVNERLL
jgi:MoaA/NifB/PqqE/SkfB family radical SAM enzyme